MRRQKINPTRDQLSTPERATLHFVEQYLMQHRRIPTQREIATSIGLSLSATYDVIQRLIAWGYLARKSDQRRARNLRVKRSASS